ncbi:MAG: diguanylate cyclase [Actinobacteria bacterium]|nr:MAG: diguanylate cyclase [Actinomycetota bacterium]
MSGRDGRGHDLRVHARSLALLYAVGGPFVVLTTSLYRPAGRDEAVLYALGGVAYLAALLLRVASRWIPGWAYPLLVALGTLLITVGIDASGDGASAYAALYIWVAVYSYYFFRRWQANLEVALAGLAYGLVLWLGPSSSGPAARWALTMGTIAVAGRLVSSLVDQVRARAAEAAARAEGLREAERRTRAIIDTANDGFVAMDEQGRVVAFSPRAEQITGFAAAEVLGRPLAETLLPARLHAGFQHELSGFLDTGRSSLVDRPIEFVGVRKGGEEFPVELTVAPLRDGERWVFNAFVRDISERKRADRAMREHTEDIARISDVARDLSGVTDAHAARPAICKAARELGAAKVAILFEPDPKGQELISTAIAGAQIEQLHLPFTAAPTGAGTAFSSGRPHFVTDTIGHGGVAQPVRDQLGVISALWQPVLRNQVPIGVLSLGWSERVEEVSERVRSLMALLAAEAAVAIERADLLARLEAVARTADLTGLANRRAWDEHLPRELARARREERPLCVAMLDLDHFKEYNDERGHQAGDRLLKQVASTWREMLRPSDLLARYGGEEFGLLLPHCPLERGLDVVERLRGHTIAGQTSSAGVAAWDGEEPADSLVSRADAALYEAKKRGRDRAVPAPPA